MNALLVSLALFSKLVGLTKPNPELSQIAHNYETNNCFREWEVRVVTFEYNNGSVSVALSFCVSWSTAMLTVDGNSKI